MSEYFSIEKLREEVNPVYSTAKSCLQIVAKLGDEDSENLRKELGLSVFGEDARERASNIPPQILEALMKAMPVFNSLPEARFFSSNNYIKESGAKTVVDLPCGYTARGIKLAKSGIRYFGLDLPAVTEAMTPAVEKTIGRNDMVSYHAVDATNYSSLRRAIEGAEGELHITTEGLLMYFTQSELETVFANVRKLLLEFGGRWVTLDNELAKAEKQGIAAVMTGMPPELAGQIGTMVAGATAKTTLSNNVFFDQDTEKVKQFVSDMGFELELVPMIKYLPEPLVSFKDLPEDVREKAMEGMRAVNFWVMTPKAGEKVTFACEKDRFKAGVKHQDNALFVSLAGRLDTITSPSLLALFREAASKGEIKSIIVDMKELEYVSSAGLRVLLIMRKGLADGQEFSLINQSEAVREIIETTGFDTIFC